MQALFTYHNKISVLFTPSDFTEVDLESGARRADMVDIVVVQLTAATIDIERADGVRRASGT